MGQHVNWHDPASELQNFKFRIILLLVPCCMYTDIQLKSVKSQQTLMGQPVNWHGPASELQCAKKCSKSKCYNKLPFPFKMHRYSAFDFPLSTTYIISICEIHDMSANIDGPACDSHWHDPTHSILVTCLCVQFFFLVIYPELQITDLVQFQMTTPVHTSTSPENIEWQISFPNSHLAQCDSFKILTNSTHDQINYTWSNEKLPNSPN